MANNVTYLVGAGASKGAVPIITEFPSALDKFSNINNKSSIGRSTTCCVEIP